MGSLRQIKTYSAVIYDNAYTPCWPRVSMKFTVVATRLFRYLSSRSRRPFVCPAVRLSVYIWLAYPVPVHVHVCDCLCVRLSVCVCVSVLVGTRLTFKAHSFPHNNLFLFVVVVFIVILSTLFL